MKFPALFCAAFVSLQTLAAANSCESTNNEYMNDTYTEEVMDSITVCIPKWEDMLFEVGEPNEIWPLPHDNSTFYVPQMDIEYWPNTSLEFSQIQNAGVKYQFIGYIQDHLEAAPTDLIKPAFAQKYGLMHGPGNNNGELAGAFKAARDEGGEYILTFGGFSGKSLAHRITDETILMNMYESILRMYNARYVNLDLQGPDLDDIAAIRRSAGAMRKVINEFARDDKVLDVILTLPASPTGLNEAVTEAIDTFVDEQIVPMVNFVMSGFPPAPETGMAPLIIDAINHALDWMPSEPRMLLGVSPQLGKDSTYDNSDSSNNIYNHDDAATVAKYVSTNGIAMLGMSNINMLDREFESELETPSPVDPGIKKKELDISKIHLCVEQRTCDQYCTIDM